MQSLVGILFSSLRKEFELFLILMGSHDRVLSREVPCADTFFELILPAAVCIMKCWGRKMAVRLLVRHLQLSRPEATGLGWDDGGVDG